MTVLESWTPAGGPSPARHTATPLPDPEAAWSISRSSEKERRAGSGSGRAPQDLLPGAYSQFLRVRGTTITDRIGDEQAITGTVQDVSRRIDDRLAAHNLVGVDLLSGPVQVRRPKQPAVTIQQIARNALVHRSWEATNAPVRSYRFDDRIDIASPGGPFGAGTAENFGEPNLAAAMRALGVVQRSGGGIAAALPAAG